MLQEFPAGRESASRFVRYGDAVLTVCAAVLLRVALDPVLGEHSPFVLFLLAVTSVAWFCGTGPGVLTIGLSTIIGQYFFVQPRHTLSLIHPHNTGEFLLCLVVGVAILVVAREYEAVLRDRRESAMAAAGAVPEFPAGRESNRSLVYIAPVLAVAAGAALRITLDPSLGERAPFVIFFLVVLSVAWFCGPGPGLLAVVLSTVVGQFFFVPPRYTLDFLHPHQLPDLLLFLLVSGATIILSWRYERLLATQHQTESDLRESRARNHGFFDLTSMGVARCDVDSGKFLDLNDAFCRIVGYTREALLHYTMDDITDRDDRGEHARLVDEQRGRGGGEFQLEQRLIRNDGSTAWVQVSTNVVRIAEARFECLIAIVDITVRKQAEEALRRAEHLVAAGRTAAILAHEINNPLQGVANTLYLVQTTDDLDVDARRMLALASREVARIGQIVRQSLNFYRMDSHPAEVHLSELIDSLLELYTSRIHNAGLTVRRRYRTNEAVIVVPGEIQQVLSNILINAIDASRPGGLIHVCVSRARDWKQGTQGIRVAIADNGTGIPETYRRRLFQPFFTTKGTNGTGLGLWVSHSIIQKHAGAMRVRSSTREGASGTLVSMFIPRPVPARRRPAENRQDAVASDATLTSTDLQSENNLPEDEARQRQLLNLAKIRLQLK